MITAKQAKELTFMSNIEAIEPEIRIRAERGESEYVPTGTFWTSLTGPLAGAHNYLKNLGYKVEMIKISDFWYTVIRW